jgi:hypothetical protein
VADRHDTFNALADGSSEKRRHFRGGWPRAGDERALSSDKNGKYITEGRAGGADN